MLELQKRRLLFCLMFWGIGFPAISWGQTGTSVYQGDWPEYHGGPLAQRYSPLDQIDADNVCLLYTSPSPRDQRGWRMAA